MVTPSDNPEISEAIKLRAKIIKQIAESSGFNIESKLITAYESGIQQGRDEVLKNNLIFIQKVREQLKGYVCGYHKKLDNMLKNEEKVIRKKFGKGGGKGL
jgi:flagellar biosynthesis/type III secretory pathway protein FliH